MKVFNEEAFANDLTESIDEYAKKDKTDYNQGYLDALMTVSAEFAQDHVEEVGQDE